MLYGCVCGEAVVGGMLSSVWWCVLTRAYHISFGADLIVGIYFSLVHS